MMSTDSLVALLNKDTPRLRMGYSWTPNHDTTKEGTHTPQTALYCCACRPSPGYTVDCPQ